MQNEREDKEEEGVVEEEEEEDEEEEEGEIRTGAWREMKQQHEEKMRR